MRPEVALPEVFSAREVARAAGVPTRRVRHLLASGTLRSIDGAFMAEHDAVRAVRALAASRQSTGDGRQSVGTDDRQLGTDDCRLSTVDLFAAGPGLRRRTGLPIAVSSLVHGAVVSVAMLVTAAGFTQTEGVVPVEEPKPLRLVYLVAPGPGGGGGGGGLRMPAPPPKALRKGKSRLSSPLPVRKPPPRVEPVAKPVEPPPPPVVKPEPLPPVVAPVVTAPADEQDRPGVLEQTTAQNNSRGPGTGGGVGSGTGTGIGEGDGSGIGPGSGGGTGGGPYRPGSGVEPPRLLREVKPDYTEEARQRGLEGDVLMEIIVRRDGTVGEVRILQGLGLGLDQRAVQAVRQWRFAPARRLGAPVDVIVEVAMEFKLR